MAVRMSFELSGNRTPPNSLTLSSALTGMPNATRVPRTRAGVKTCCRAVARWWDPPAGDVAAQWHRGPGRQRWGFPIHLSSAAFPSPTSRRHAGCCDCARRCPTYGGSPVHQPRRPLPQAAVWWRHGYQAISVPQRLLRRMARQSRARVNAFRWVVRQSTRLATSPAWRFVGGAGQVPFSCPSIGGEHVPTYGLSDRHPYVAESRSISGLGQVGG